MIVCRIVLEYRSESAAEAVFRSVEGENSGYVEGKIEGKKLIFEASSDSAMSLSHTINDLLACIKASESSLDL